MPHYRKGYRGREFDEVVTRLSEENRLSPVVKSSRGYHIIELIEKTQTRFESKREEILSVLGSRAANAVDSDERVIDVVGKWTSKFNKNKSQVDIVLGMHRDKTTETPGIIGGTGSGIG